MATTVMENSLPSPPAKRQKLPYHHKHRIQHRPPVVPGEYGVLPQDVVDKFLIQSIKTICEEVAHRQEIGQPYIESVALESLRAAADEFAHNLCEKIQRSMVSARRTVPIATDFDSAFYALDLPLPDDQILPYAVKTEINRPLLPTPPPDDEFHHSYELPETILGSELSRQQDLKKFSFNIASLPPVPSAHTYRDTDVFPKREKDSKKIRERATEEGKLGEAALRKLAGAVKLEAVLSTEPETRYVTDRRPRRLRRGPVLTEEAMFEETMRELLKSEPDGFELGPVVSSEMQYRMPDENRVRRRPLTTANVAPPPSTAKPSAASARQYSLVPPPISKPRSSAPPAEDMDISFDI